MGNKALTIMNEEIEAFKRRSQRGGFDGQVLLLEGLQRAIRERLVGEPNELKATDVDEVFEEANHPHHPYCTPYREGAPVGCLHPSHRPSRGVPVSQVPFFQNFLLVRDGP